MRQYPNLEINEFTSFMVKRRRESRFYRILEHFTGNILIVAIKQ